MPAEKSIVWHSTCNLNVLLVYLDDTNNKVDNVNASLHSGDNMPCLTDKLKLFIRQV
jgi:hypothetical protein